MSTKPKVGEVWEDSCGYKVEVVCLSLMLGGPTHLVTYRPIYGYERAHSVCLTETLANWQQKFGDGRRVYPLSLYSSAWD